MCKCWYCDGEFNQPQVEPHQEHIIPNALGGRLLDRYVLCKRDGCALGSTVDHELVSELEILRILTNTARERKNGKSDARLNDVRLFFEHTAGSIEFDLRDDFSIVPGKPFYYLNHEEKKLYLFGASKRQVKDFKESAEVRALLDRGYDPLIILNVADHVASASIKIATDSPSILRGIMKVALSYASLHGVRRVYLDMAIQALQSAEDDILSDFAWQYFPVGILERIYETTTSEHEDGYPTHQLYLFSCGTSLYCYVGLWGAIQKYVRLSTNYRGAPIRMKYIQRTRAHDFQEADWIAKSLSDLQILAVQFDVPLVGSIESIQENVITAARMRTYELDPDSQTQKLQAIIDSIAFSCLMPDSKHDILRASLLKWKEASAYFASEASERFVAGEIFSPQEGSEAVEAFRKGTELSCYPMAAREVSSRLLDNYANMKLTELLAFCLSDQAPRFRLNISI